MKPVDYKSKGKKRRIKDRYSKLKERNNPNRYYLVDNVYVIVTPQPLKERGDYMFLVSLETPVDKVKLTFNKRTYVLNKLLGSAYIGKIDIDTLPNKKKIPVLLELEKDKIIYYKVFEVAINDNVEDWKPFLEEQSSGLKYFDVYPKQFSRSVSQNYKDVPQNYSEHNLLNTKIAGVTSNLNIRGVKSFTYRSKLVKGSKPGSVSGTKRDELLLVNINGKAGPVEVEATIQDSTLDFDNTNNNSVKLSTSMWDLFFGEYVANLNRSELAAFSKRLDGVTVIYKKSPFRVEALTSVSKGVSTYEQLHGNNSQGPYFLRHAPVVIYSESVKFNGHTLERQQDYEIDYDLGQIILKKHFLLNTELIEVDYEFSESTFKRALTAVDLEYVSSENSNMYGVTILNQNDLVDENRGSVVSGSDTISHSVIALRSDYKFSESVSTKQELGLSNKRNKLNHNTSTGLAFKEGFSYKSDQTVVAANIKKIGPSYETFGNPSLYPGLLGYDFSFETSPKKSTTLYGDHDFRRYFQNEGNINEELLDLGLRLGPASYRYYKRFDSDLSDTQSKYSQQVERNNLGYLKTLGFVQLKPSVEYERVTYTFEPDSNERNKALKIDTMVVGINKFNLTTHTELKNKSLDTGETQFRNSYGFISNIEPVNRYSFNGAAEYVHDSKEGKSALSSIGYKFRISRRFQTNGDYELETVKMDLNNVPYRVIKRNANIKFRVRPRRNLTFKYRLKPQNEEILGSNLRYKNKFTHQLQMDTILFSNGSLNIAYKNTKKSSLKLNSLPLVETSKSQRKNTTLLNYNFETEKQSSFRYNLEYDTDFSTDYNQPSELSDYEKLTLLQSSHQFGYSKTIKSDIKIDSDFQHSETKTLQKYNDFGNQHLLSDSIELSSEWKTTPKLNTKLTGGSTLQREKIQDLNDTFLLTPRVDLFYRPNQNWQWNTYFEYTRSVSGETRESYKASLRSRYNVRLFNLLNANLIAQLDFETEKRPVYYEIWDFLVQFSINL
ncbi:hypothetical protein DID80_05305 [Candidatus Marinamargulisbacteria bacterium SCGC AAA071-K20]|nr:hypothetical protein DID80_05305 [Candidatus Marinamargulisbacteria bacterium SCGC AAA071-K20]